MPFTFIVEDVSGNSFVENPSAPTADQYCKKTHWIRTLEDYEFMGYPADQATLQAEADRLNADERKKQAEDSGMKNFIPGDKNVMVQTKEEQEALLAKLTPHATQVDKKAQVDAGYVDFSKPIDEQDQKDELADDDPRKQVMKFPTPCYNC